MKKKGFKFHEAKERPSRPKSVNQKKPNRENWARIPENARARESQRMPEPGNPWDAQHSLNKITMAENDKWVLSTQSCSEKSESIK